MSDKPHTTDNAAVSAADSRGKGTRRETKLHQMSMGGIGRRQAGAHKGRLIGMALAVVAAVAFMSGTQVLGATVSGSFDKVFENAYQNVDAVTRSNKVVDTPFGEERAWIDENKVAEVAKAPGAEKTWGQVLQPVRITDTNMKAIYNPNQGPPTFLINWLEDGSSGWALSQGKPPVGDNQIVVDDTTWNTQHFKEGDVITLAGSGGSQKVTVVGAAKFDGLGNYAGSPAVLAETKTAQKWSGQEGTYTWIGASAKPGVSQQELVSQIQQQVKDAQVVTGQTVVEENQAVFRSFIGIFTTIISAFGLIALIVGSFIIYNTFSVVIAQRRKEFALLRAVGASKNQILSSVLQEAAALAVAASALGLVFGIGLAKGLVALLGKIGLDFGDTSLSIPWINFLIPVTAAVSVTLLAAAAPAWQAAKTAPIEAMGEKTVNKKQRLIANFIGAVAVVAGLVIGVINARNSQLGGVGIGLLLLIGGVVILGPSLFPDLGDILGWPVAKTRGIAGALARGNLKRSRSRVAASAAAVLIGAGMVMAGLTVAGGIKTAANKAVDGQIKADYLITGDSYLGLNQQIVGQVQEAAGNDYVAAIYAGGGTAAGQVGVIAGTNPKALEKTLTVTWTAGGSITDGVAISETLAKNKNVNMGDTIEVKLSGGSKKLPVQGIWTGNLATGAGGNGAVEALINDTDFKAITETGQTNALVIYIKNSGTDTLKPALEKIVAGQPGAEVADLQQVKAAQSKQIDQLLSFLLSLVTLVAVIAGIAVWNTIGLSVHERSREIGLLRAVGATKNQIRTSLRWEAALICIVGAVGGVIVGTIGGWLFLETQKTALGDVPLTTEPVAAVVIVILCLIGGTLAGAWPAYKASRANIVTAVANE